MNKRSVWFLEARTGCTCCEYENRLFGPFPEIEFAKDRKASLATTTQFASQYSKNGNYYISTAEAEVLPDGRLIVGDRVFAADVLERGMWAEELGHPDQWNSLNATLVKE